MPPPPSLPEVIWHYAAVQSGVQALSVAFSFDGLHHVACHTDGSLSVVDVASMRVRDVLRQQWSQALFTHSSDVVAVTSSLPNDQHVYLVSLTTATVIAGIGCSMDAPVRRASGQLSPLPSTAGAPRSGPGASYVTGIQQSPASDIIAVADAGSGRVALHHPSVAGKPLAATQPFGLKGKVADGAGALAFSEDGMTVAVAHGVGGATLFDLRRVSQPLVTFDATTLFSKQSRQQNTAVSGANECCGVSLSAAGLLAATSNFGEVVLVSTSPADTGPAVRCTYFHGDAVQQFHPRLPSVRAGAVFLRPWDSSSSPLLHQGTQCTGSGIHSLLVYSDYKEPDDVMPDQSVQHGALWARLMPHVKASTGPAMALAVNRQLGIISVASAGFTWWSVGGKLASCDRLK
jgi:hypothetical protein